MKRLLHPDYWAEVPAGEFIAGLSQRHREAIVAKILDLAGRGGQEGPARARLASAERKLCAQPPARLDRRERALLRERLQPRDKIHVIEEQLLAVRARTRVHLEGFFIARFPLTRAQHHAFLHGTSPSELPGPLEEPAGKVLEIGAEPRRVPGRQAAAFRAQEALELCLALDARLPTELEWEKAARGTDGRLYPWGNEWNSQAGFFYYGQSREEDSREGGRRVDAFPLGVSPYGAWSMAGGLPEWVSVAQGRPVMTREAAFNGAVSRARRRGNRVPRRIDQVCGSMDASKRQHDPLWGLADALTTSLKACDRSQRQLSGGTSLGPRSGCVAPAPLWIYDREGWLAGNRASVEGDSGPKGTRRPGAPTVAISRP